VLSWRDSPSYGTRHRSIGLASTPAGCILESFTDPERDPLQAELFEDPPRIANGWVTLNDAPGLGLTLSGAALKKYGEQVL
jgi:L-alanine-DL-glutamate epimerase-like enolase superfamily enzyme